MTLQSMFITVCKLQMKVGKQAIKSFMTPSADLSPCVWHLAMQCAEHRTMRPASLHYCLKECHLYDGADSC